MEVYFNLFLRALTSIIILYLAFNTIFRYHPSIRMADFLLISFTAMIGFFFMDTGKMIAFSVVFGVILILYLGIRIYLFKKHTEWLLLLGILDRKPETVKQEVETLLVEADVSMPNVQYAFDKPYLLQFHAIETKKIKTFAKKLDQYLQKQPKRFGLFQYFHFVVVLILMVAIWRF